MTDVKLFVTYQCSKLSTKMSSSLFRDVINKTGKSSWCNG